MNFEEKFEIIQQVIPNEYKFNFNDQIDDDILNLCLEFLIRIGHITEFSKVDIELFQNFDRFIYYSDIYYSQLINPEKNYTILLPGNSPSLFWYCLTLKYPEIQEINHIIFPISGIKNYDKDILKLHGTKKLEMKKKQDEQDIFLENYFFEILKDVNENTNFAYIDFIFEGKLLTQLQKIFKNIGYIGDIDKFNIDYSPNFRCIQEFKVNDIDYNIQFNYFICNIIIYIFNNYIYNKHKVKKLYEDINYNIIYDTHIKINNFNNKYVNIKYIERDDNNLKFIELKNVFLEKDNHNPLIYLNGEKIYILKIYIYRIIYLKYINPY